MLVDIVTILGAGRLKNTRRGLVPDTIRYFPLQSPQTFSGANLSSYRNSHRRPINMNTATGA